MGARKVGAQEGRSPPSPAPHHHTPASFFPVICALGKHGWVPGRDACHLGSEEKQQPGTRACACPCPASRLRVSVWEQVGGRVSCSLALCGHLGPQHQSGREALGRGKEPPEEGQLWPIVQWKIGPCSQTLE